MASVQSGKMIVGLDIGTSKVVALVGEVTADGQLEVVGIGTHPSRGLKKGVVVNIESTVQSIQRAIDEAQHRYRDLHRRRDPPYRGDPDRRRPGHQ